MINFFQKFSFVLCQKRQFFAKFFGENILKIITSVPGFLVITFAVSATNKVTRKQSWAIASARQAMRF
jgi:hypothetical protein